MSFSSLSFDSLDDALDGHDRVDMPCPLCSAERSTPSKRKAKVFTAWRLGPRAISYHCCHCEISGYVCDANAARHTSAPKLKPIAKSNAAAHRKQQLRKALFLWRRSGPLASSLGTRYLEAVRGIAPPYPSTLRFLPPLKEGHHPSIVAAFGFAQELEPGVLAIDDASITGVHLTLLDCKTGQKADIERNKLMIGSSSGWPIMLAPVNDLGGLAIVEGVEDGLSVHAATRLGAWASGSANRLPRLADVVPDYLDHVLILAHTDLDRTGERNAFELQRRLRQRGIHCDVITLPGAD